MSEDEFILLWLALRHGSVISVPARGHIHTLLREMGPRKVFWPLSYWAISSIRSKVAGSFIYYLAPGLTGGFFEKSKKWPYSFASHLFAERRKIL